MWNVKNMSIYETPRYGAPGRRASYSYHPPEPKSLEELIGLEECAFKELSKIQKQQVVANLFRALDENTFPFTDLQTDDQFQILDFIFSFEEEYISFFLETPTVQQKFLHLVSRQHLGRVQAVKLALQIMISKGIDAVRTCDFLTYGEKQEARTKYYEQLKKVFPNAIVPSEFEEIKEFAFNRFSGARKVPASMHHYVLVGLLYAKNPDIELIQLVATKYLLEQQDYFSKKGFSRVVREQEEPVVSSDYSRHRAGKRMVSALHPGGFYASISFLSGDISGVDIDDEKPGLRVYPIASVADERLVRRAQAVAAQNMDFPAFLKISHVLTNQIDYNTQTGECRIYPSVELEEDDFEIVPLQPRVNCPSKERLERWYSSKYAERLYQSLKHPISIENPKDPVRRVLFPDAEEEVTQPMEPSSASENDKHFLYFIFKCLLGLFFLKIGFHIFEYFRAKFSTE